MKVNSFHDAAVRDLSWVINSPVLLDTTCYRKGVGIIDDAFCRRQYQQAYNWLQQQDQAPRVLYDWLSQRKSHRLGYYFETLVEYWLRHWAGDVAAHVPVRSGKRTMGEFDFLFIKPGSRVLQHWEVAVKFYLAYYHTDGRLLFYGPQARDRLDLKVTHMLEHQSQLSKTSEGRQAIALNGIADVFDEITANVLLKGYLFYPSDDDWNSAAISGQGISSTHLRGWWTRSDELRIPTGFTDSCWYRLPRLRWLAPAEIPAHAVHELVKRRDLATFCREQFSSHMEPFLLAEMHADNDGNWREVSRGFVVPDTWPNEPGR